MPRILFLLSIISILFLSSCGFKEKHDAQELYYKIRGINDTLDKYTSEWHGLLQDGLIKKNYSSLYDARIKLGSYISESRMNLSKVTGTPANEKLRNDEETLLASQAIVVADVYPVFEQYSALTPTETVQKSVLLLGNDLNNTKIGIEKVRTDLQAFSLKYKLKK